MSEKRDPLDILRETDPEAADRMVEMLSHAVRVSPDISGMEFQRVPAEGATCAHVTVSGIYAPPGGRWACDSCGAQFQPVPPAGS